MRRRFWLLLALSLTCAACGGSSNSTGSVTVPTTTNATSTTTTTTTVTTPTFTFTGSECIYSGPDAFPSREFIKITAVNESSADLVVVVLELIDVTLEDLVADARVFPPTESFPPAAPEPPEVHRFFWLEPGTFEFDLVFSRAGDFGTACWPIDGNSAIQGTRLTVE